MTASTTDQLVADYLSRLDRAARDLPPGRRDELIDEIREHIATARAAGAAADEAAVRTMLDRLGDPGDIVAAAIDSERGNGSALVPVRPGTGFELAAVVLLTVGSFVPFIGWAAGVILLWAAKRWTTREKLLGTLVVPGGPGLALWLSALTPTQVCSSVMETADDGSVSATETCSGFALHPAAGIPLFLIVLVAPFVVAGLLYSRARARAEVEDTELRPAGAVSAWTGHEITAVWLLAGAALFAVVGTLVFGFVGLAVISALALAVGLILVWTSDRWTPREKSIGTAIAVAPGLLAAIAIAVNAIIERI